MMKFFLGLTVLLSLALFNVSSAQEQRQTDNQRNRDSEMNAFVGSWQLDPSRTKIGSTTISYEQAGDRMRVTSPRGTFTFKIDGADYPTAIPGETISWKQIDKNTFESTVKRNGKPIAIATRVFSPDGKAILVTTKTVGDKPTTLTSRMERQSDSSGSHPFIGTWKQRRENPSAETGRIAYTTIANGLHVRYDGPLAQEYDLVFDGREREVDGGGPTASLVVRKVNDRSVEEKWTRDGKLFTTSTITVSADGQELIERHQPADAHAEPSIYVYRRVK
jgi:hypothetical protein